MNKYQRTKLRIKRDKIKEYRKRVEEMTKNQVSGFQNELGLSESFFETAIRKEIVRDFSTTVILADREERAATEEEQRILSSILAGALSTISFYACKDGWNGISTVKDTAEFTAISFFGVESEINFYDTVYNRIQKIIDLFTERTDGGD